MARRDLILMVCGAAVAAALFGAYRWMSAPGNPPAPPPAAAVGAIPSVAASTAKLAARLQKSGGSAADWQLLGRSYEFLGRKEQAAAAFAQAAGKLPEAAAAGATMRLTGTVEVAPALRAKLPAEAILFVLAKSAVLTGPPLAVVKIPVKHWPVRFQLDDSNAMMPAAKLSSAEIVIVEARVSLTGNPMAQRGDLAGSLSGIDPHKDRALRLVIDHLVR
jgi:hypothetical protein